MMSKQKNNLSITTIWKNQVTKKKQQREMDRTNTILSTWCWWHLWLWHFFTFSTTPHQNTDYLDPILLSLLCLIIFDILHNFEGVSEFPSFLVKSWIGEVMEEPFPDATFADALRNGVLLCRLINCISMSFSLQFEISECVCDCENHSN